MKNGAIIGAITGLIVVGARVLFVFLYHSSDKGTSITIAKIYLEMPLFWMTFGLPLGAMIGVFISTILGYFNIKWRIVNLVLGAILGYGATWVLFVIIFFIMGAIDLIFIPLFGKNPLESQIWGKALLIGLGLTDLYLPGAIIGAIVGLLFKGKGS